MTTPARAMTPEKIRERSDRFADLSRLKLQQAQEELDRGDTAQAAEKIYGALTNMVKACGELRGWNHYNHHRVDLIIDQLAEENGQPQLAFAQTAAIQFHSNFFEHEFTAFRVQAGIDSIKTAIEQLEAIRQQPAPPAPSRQSLTQEQRRRLTLLNQPPEKPPGPAGGQRPKTNLSTSTAAAYTASAKA